MWADESNKCYSRPSKSYSQPKNIHFYLSYNEVKLVPHILEL